MAINLNDNLLVNAPKAADKRYGPYETEAAAKAALPPAVRFEGLTVGILSGGLKEYWFKGGIADGNLVEKIAGAPTSGIPLSKITAKGDIVVGLGNQNPGTLPVGNDGEFLVADSNQELGVKWASSEGGIPASIIDSKGDIIVGASSDTPSRFPVGANGKFLVADSAETLGVKWGTATIETTSFVTDTIGPGNSQEFWIDFGNLFSIISVTVSATYQDGWLRAYTSASGMAADDRTTPGPTFPPSSSGFILELVTTSSEPSVLLTPVPTYYSQSGVVFKFTNQSSISEVFTLDFKYLTVVETPPSPYCTPAYQYLVPTASPYSCNTEVNTAGETDFTEAWKDCTAITSFPCVDSSAVTDFSYAWSGCSAMTSFPTIDTSAGTNFTYSWAGSDLTSFPQIDTSSGTNFYGTWSDCSYLSSFPELDLSGGTDFTYAWYDCGSLTTLPSTLDLSSGTDFYGAWAYCTALTSFPILDLSNGTDFSSAWAYCTSLTSFPENLNLSSGSDFGDAWYGCSGLTSFPALDLGSGTDFISAWQNCTNLTSFPGTLNLSSGTIFQQSWYNCTSLTSFPGTLDLSSGTNFQHAWANCTNLTSFPETLNLSSGDYFSGAWSNCTSLTSFPGTLDLSSGIFFNNAWDGCSSLTSFPGTLNFSSANTFLRAWADCISLTSFPAGVFNSCPAVNFDNAWSNCALDQTSVDNILVSLDSTGLTGGIVGISGGTSSPPSTTIGSAAISSLVGKSWIVTTN